MSLTTKNAVSLCFGAGSFCLFFSAFYLMWWGDFIGNEIPHFASRIAEIVACLGLSMAHTRFMIDPRTGSIAAFVCGSAGMLLGFSGLLASVLSGVAAGCFMVTSLLFFSRFESRSSCATFVVSMLVSHVVSTAASFLTPDIAAIVKAVFTCVAPILMAVALSLSNNPDAGNEEDISDDKSRMGGARTMVVGMVAFALLCGFATQVFIEKGAELGLVNLFGELSCILLLAFLLLVFLLLQGVTLETSLLVTLSIFAIVLLMGTTLFAAEPINAGVFVRAGFDVYQVMMWLLFIERTRRDPVFGCRIFALTDGLLRLGVLGGRFAAVWCCAELTLDGVSNAMFAVIVIWLLITVILLFTTYALERKAATLPALDIEMNYLAETEFECKCTTFADAYHLSSREKEVMEHFVHGRSTPHIAKTLFISENTVKTHIRRIYQKTDVHSRQELLDKIESCNPN